MITKLPLSRGCRHDGLSCARGSARQGRFSACRRTARSV